MKRLVVSTLVAIAVVTVARAQADPANYGIDSVSASLGSSQAGAHADFTTSIVLKTENFELPALTRDVSVELPPGLLANPSAVPKCSAAQFVATDVEVKSSAGACPQDSQVGVTHIIFSNEHEGTASFVEPVFNLTPRPGEPARLGFIALQYPILIDTELRPDYGVTAMVKGADTLATLYTTETTLWGVPADKSHDDERMTPYESAHNRGGIETPTGTRPSGLTPTPYMVSPTQCDGPLPVRATAVSYQLPNVLSEGSSLLPGMTGCSLLDFKPDLSIAPSTSQASSGSGLSVKLGFPTEGFEDPDLYAEAGLRKVQVVLPEGLTINPAQANGLGACSAADFARERAGSGPGEGCPESSKIGTATARSPLLDEEAEGALYVATPHANPFGTLIALYLVLRVPERGVIVKLAGKVEPDPNTGRLVSVFGDAPYEIPQLPVSSFELRFREGARAPLVTPSRCGSYAGTATFTSWAGQVAITHPGFAITAGHGGDACPSGAPAFNPHFTGGTRSNNAGSYSPLVMRIRREDGEQELSRFSVQLPRGLVAKLAGASECPATAIETARGKTGLIEIASPSCPASSEIGDLLAGAGVGPELTYVTGKLYLAGPYRGAPLSVIAIVPAVAGPFDLGTVAIREPLHVDPRTAVVKGGGPDGDPIPRMLEGIPLDIRDVRLDFDRPSFTLNPTSCDPSALHATLWGSGGDLFSPADDSHVSLDDRFQATNCRRLSFRPKLALKLFGQTRRGGNPRLRAVLKMPLHSANIKGASVALPDSEFLDQSHIRTICTRVQFAANDCPAASVYGRATAKTPLLDRPLTGPVYLRSSRHELPDLVADLRGQIHITLVGRIDSIDGGIRTTFSTVPDAPVSSFVLKMQGGKKGLLENSRDLCRRPARASARFTGQNGKFSDLAPVVNANCGKERPSHGK